LKSSRGFARARLALIRKGAAITTNPKNQEFRAHFRQRRRPRKGAGTTTNPKKQEKDGEVNSSLRTTILGRNRDRADAGGTPALPGETANASDLMTA